MGTGTWWFGALWFGGLKHLVLAVGKWEATPNLQKGKLINVSLLGSSITMADAASSSLLSGLAGLGEFSGRASGF